MAVQDEWKTVLVDDLTRGDIVTINGETANVLYVTFEYQGNIAVVRGGAPTIKLPAGTVVEVWKNSRKNSRKGVDSSGEEE